MAGQFQGYSTQVFSGYVGAEGGQALVDYTVETIQSLWQEEDQGT